MENMGCVPGNLFFFLSPCHIQSEINLDLVYFFLIFFSESVKFFETYLSLAEMSSCKMHQAFPSLKYKSYFAHLISGTGSIFERKS